LKLKKKQKLHQKKKQLISRQKPLHSMKTPVLMEIFSRKMLNQIQTILSLLLLLLVTMFHQQNLPLKKVITLAGTKWK